VGHGCDEVSPLQRVGRPNDTGDRVADLINTAAGRQGTFVLARCVIADADRGGPGRHRWPRRSRDREANLTAADARASPLPHRAAWVITEARCFEGKSGQLRDAAAA
jgi:hypothetical protein